LILLGISAATTLGRILGLLGLLLGPSLAGIILNRVTRGKEGNRDYWWRVIDVKRIGVKCGLVILLFVPVLHAISYLVDILLGGGGGTWGQSALEFVANPASIIIFILLTLFLGPLEEFGWRGYALDRLQERRNALTSSLILGVMWALWHLPLFFFEGTYQNNLGFGSPAFWQFMLGIVPLAFIFTLIFNNTRRSILSAILFHFMINFTGDMFALSEQGELIYTILWAVAAVLVIVTWGAKSFTRSGKLPL
jgi:membrane protease YdiL (CAAX protease family)